MSKDTKSLCHMNIRSLSTHHDELSLLLAGLSLMRLASQEQRNSLKEGFSQTFASLDIILILSQPKVQLVELHYMLILH